MFLCIDCGRISYSLGLFGKHEDGLVRDLCLTDKVDFITAGLSKAFCTRAGLIAGSHKSLKFIREHSSNSMFSSAILNFDIVRADSMLNVIMNACDEKEKRFNGKLCLFFAKSC